MTKTIRLASNLELPIEVVTQAGALIARRGAGKTYAATKIAEQMLEAGAQVLVCDPVGTWFGLRLKADGKTDSGLPIYIFGGEYADVPITPEAGREIARLLATKPISAVLDVSRFRKGDRVRFMTDFAEEFFHLKKSHRTPVHLFIEEAQVFIPQQVTPGDARMVGAFEDVVRLGRNFGIGITMISQRPQSVNKQVLSQVEFLITLQVTGPHERKAIDDWVTEHGVDRKMTAELPSLRQGEAFFWSPGWLRTFQKIQILKKHTYDASSTPVLGVAAAKPVQLSPKDIDALSTELQASIERAKEDDPKELRRRILELERTLSKELSKPVAIVPAPEPVIRYVDRPVLTEEHLQRLENAHYELTAAVTEIESALGRLDQTPAMDPRVDTTCPGPDSEPVLPSRPPRPQPSANGHSASGPVSRAPRPSGPGSIGIQMHRKIMTALAQHPEGLSKQQILLHTGYASSGSTSTAFADLTKAGYMSGEGMSGLFIATDAGIAALGDYDPLPTGDRLREFLLRSDKLSTMEKALLGAVTAAYPHAIPKGEVLRKVGYASSGSTSTAFARLVRYTYLVAERSGVRANARLFGK